MDEGTVTGFEGVDALVKCDNPAFKVAYVFKECRRIAEPPQKFNIGDRVEVTNDGSNWFIGTVTEFRDDINKAMVQCDNPVFKVPFFFHEYRVPSTLVPLATAVLQTTPSKTFNIGDRVEVRNDDQAWYIGTVTGFNDDNKALVKPDNPAFQDLPPFAWNEYQKPSTIPNPISQPPSE